MEISSTSHKATMLGGLEGKGLQLEVPGHLPGQSTRAGSNLGSLLMAVQ